MSANQVDRLRGATSGEREAGTFGSFDRYRKILDAGPVALSASPLNGAGSS